MVTKTVKKISKKERVDPLSNKYIEIKGARVHNLKNIDVRIPKNNLVVVTGVSGSGKSSLVMDVLFAEGQRKYVESLSSYARQFLVRMDKPDVDYIKGISPAIAIEQKVNNRNTRSTVGTMTEIYDYLKLLFARIGKTYSPISGKEVKKHTVTDVVNELLELKEGSKIQILASFQANDLKKELKLLVQKGFTRIYSKGKVYRIDELLDASSKSNRLTQTYILIDRLAINKNDADTTSRIADSVQTAFYEGHGECSIEIEGKGLKPFSNKFELDGIAFEEPTPHLFNFNNPYGACKTCEGFGSVIGINEDLVIPDKNLSVYENAVACWRGEKMKKWKERLLKVAMDFDFPIHRAYKDLNEKEKQLLWTGNKQFKGIDAFFEYLESKAYKIQYRVMLSRYRGRKACPDCKGTRIRPDAAYIKIQDKNIFDLLLMPISELFDFISKIKVSAHDKKIAERLLNDINKRLTYLCNLGLEYITLNRPANTLSGGETQRINLTRTLGSNLTSSLYILDEPSVGLHPRDTHRMIKVLHNLKRLGNTVIVVEHEEEVIKSADYLIDMGPLAGHLGGEVVFQGKSSEVTHHKASLTAQYLLGEKEIAVPKIRRKVSSSIEIKGVKQNNLKNISVKFPLNMLIAVCGVSGSGKTTLIKQLLYPALKQHLEEYGEKPGLFDELKGSLQKITQIELVDQNPLGRSSRSNPVTYVKAYDAIRDLYSKQQLSKIKGFKPKHFSFNVEGGRCETCKGDGEVVIEMQFLADVHLVCDACKGKRFQEEVLSVQYKEKNIADVLDMTIDEALSFFEDKKDVITKLKPLQDVGLGYMKLGQPSSTLSGGEAQRVKLASFLNKGSTAGSVLFIFDEPTTGLHFNDIHNLLAAFNALIENGHSVIVIEHNLDVIKSADWVIELGPEGGEKGGYLIYEGTPEELVSCKDSPTSVFLKEKL